MIESESQGTSVLSAADTQPVMPVAVNRHRRWIRPLLLTLMLALLVTLTASVGLVLHELRQQEAQPVDVTLQLGAERYRLASSAKTVGDLLQAQDVRVGADDVIVPPRDTPLRDGLRVRVEQARPVQVTVDGETRILRTTFENPYDILQQADIQVDALDQVQVDGQSITPANLVAWPLPASEIVIQNALDVTIVDGDTTYNLRTTGDTVGDALFEADVELFMADRVQPPISTPLEPDMRIVVERARPVTIEVDGETVETRVQGGTVADALARANVQLKDEDYTVPSRGRELVPGMTVRVMRVTQETITEEEPIQYETVYQADSEMELDTRAVVQAGQEGVYQRTSRVRYENGSEVSREVVDEGVARPPQNRVVAYGTNVVIRTVNTPEGPREYWRKLRMYATSYKPEALGGDRTTSIGETLRKGIIAIDPDIVSYRTEMYVPDYGVGTAADTGGPRSTPYWVDLGYTNDNWVPWSGWVDVYLLTPVPDDIDYMLPATSGEGGPVK